MEKLLELEKKLKEYKESLDKMNDEVNGSFEQSEKHPDEKEDKRLMAEALDEHNEKKHNEPKDKDSAYKDLHVKKEEGDVIKMEEVKFAKNGQWSLEKAKLLPKPQAANIPAKKPEGPKIGTKDAPVPIGEKGNIKVAHAGSDEHNHNFNVHKDGKRIGSIHMAHDDHDAPGGSVQEDNEHSYDNHDTAHEIVVNHVKKYPENYKAPLKKGLGSKLDNAEHKAKVSQALGSIRQPAKVTNAAGETKMVSPKEQVADQKSVKANKASEAAERRAAFKKKT